VPVEEVTSKREAEALRASPAAIEARYQKAEGVYVDARYLTGRSYSAVREQVEAQLGPVLTEEELTGDGGKRVRFERGVAQVGDDTIYMLELPLPEHLRRTEALAVLGFPPATGEYQVTNKQFRLLNTWGFRRIIFHRVEAGSEEIDRVEVWKETPMDRLKGNQ
jgi:hypothetical protein